MDDLITDETIRQKFTLEGAEAALGTVLSMLSKGKDSEVVKNLLYTMSKPEAARLLIKMLREL